MLAEDQKSQLRQVLKDAERRVLQSARSALDISREGPTDQGRDSIDQSTAEELVSTAMRLRDREQKLLTKIRGAIERLEDDVVDECESCGGSIGFKRLMVRPVTTLCIECKERSEEQERRLVGVEEVALGPSEESADEWSES